MDVRGYGASSKRKVHLSLRHAEFGRRTCAAVIDAVGGRNAILFGHDWGAPIAWNTALPYAPKVELLRAKRALRPTWARPFA